MNTTANAQQKQKSDWRVLGDDVWRKCGEACERPAFIIYFSTVIVWLGGIGFWIPVGRFFLSPRTAQSASDVAAALATFLLAVTASAMGDIVLAGDEQAEEGAPVTRKGFRMLTMGLSIFVVPLAFVALHNTHPTLGVWCAILGTLVSLILWILVNAESHKWREPDAPQESVGGASTDVPLTGNLGSITTG